MTPAAVQVEERTPNSAAPRVVSDASHAGYRADIDGLRALAVLVVIVFHLDETWLPAGFVGVDIFFVISGYVVLASLLRKPSPSVAHLLAHFYARRAKRLMPSLVVVIICTVIMLAVTAHAQDPPSLEEFYASGLVSLVGGANIYFNVLAENAHVLTANARRRGPTPPPPPAEDFATANNCTIGAGVGDLAWNLTNATATSNEGGVTSSMYFGGMAGLRRLTVAPLLTNCSAVAAANATANATAGGGNVSLSSEEANAGGTGIGMYFGGMAGRRLNEGVAVHDLHRNPFMHMWSLGVEVSHAAAQTLD